MKIVREVSGIANEVMEAGWAVTSFEALQLAVKIQHNRILSEALMLGSDKYPGALEAIAMALGVENNGRSGVVITREREK